MDRFLELESQVAAAAARVAELIKLGKRAGFQRPGARSAMAELRALMAAFEVCMSEPVTEEFLERTLAQCEATMAALLPMIREGPGMPN